MTVPLRVLMICAEYAPLAKAGGLADMVAGLSRALARRGCDVRVIVPRYGPAGDTAATLPVIGGVQTSPVRHGDTHPAWRLHAVPGHPGEPRLYLVDSPPFFGGGTIYGGGDAESLRFSLLAHAALRACELLGWEPDVAHCHDWHAALAPVLLRGPLAGRPPFAHTRSLLTIHNIGYQGDFPLELAEALGLAAVLPLLPERDRVAGRINFLHAGITCAQALSTVSPTHAEEITTPAYGHGLDAVLRARRGVLSGILNGVDYEAWDPARDPHLAVPYDMDGIGGKAACTRWLRLRAGLHERPSTPLLGIVTRLAEQKGIGLMTDALPRFLAAGAAQAVILGDGEPRFVAALDALAQAFPGECTFIRAHDEGLARAIFAGSDGFLVPSLYEPCGLTQLYALRYGSVPVVRATGGLQDTVMHFDPATGEGTGSVFRDADATGLAWAIDRLLEWYRQPAVWSVVRRNGMARDFSWAHQAPLYEALYRRMPAG